MNLGAKKKPRKRHKGLILGTTAALALAIGGGGAWAATSYLGTDVADPESRLPASTSAFASFNLAVSQEQQRQLLDLVAKFPAAAVTAIYRRRRSRSSSTCSNRTMRTSRTVRSPNGPVPTRRSRCGSTMAGRTVWRRCPVSMMTGPTRAWRR